VLTRPLGVADGKNMALSPAAWSVVQQVGRLLLGSLFYFVIAGILGPTEIGVLGIASVWIAFLGVFAELGFGAALIQRREIDDRHLTTVFIVNVAVAILLFVAGAAVSWPTSHLMRTPEAQPVILALSGGFVINAFSTVQTALAARQLRFRALALRDLGGVLAGGIIGVGLAWAGWGVWSLVVQSLTAGLVGTALLWRMSPYRPRLRDWSPDVLADLWVFGSRLFGLNLFKYFVQNADSLIIGYFFGPVRLGFYALGNKVLTQPITAVESGLGSFLFSRAAGLQTERARLVELYATSYKSLNYLVLPFVAVAAVWGGILVSGILGPEWGDMGLIFGFLAVMGAMHPPITPMGQLMKALGKSGWFLRWGIAFSMATTGALLVGSRFGFGSALAGLACAYVAMLPFNFAVLSRLLPGALPRVLRVVAPSYISGAVFGIVLLCFRLWGGDHLSVAVVSTIVATLVYILVVRRSDPEFEKLLRRQVIGLRAA
jgi:O-antigen/teichoic acid export membrane protein